MLLNKKKRYMKKILPVICMMVVCCMLFTGCGSKKDKNGSMKAEDGRSYGGLIEAELGETVSTAFFDVIVKEASKYDTYQFEDGLYQADSGNTYLVVKITIKNTYEKDLPMSITDFTLDYDGNKSKDVITGYGKTDLNQDDFMENIFTLRKGESITKYVLFTVADKKAYTLNYTEYYEDEFEGNKFKITINPEKKAASSEDAKGAASTDASTADDGTTEAATAETTTEASTAAETSQTEEKQE